MSNFKTAESVSPKHPDKICDQISDAILDAYLALDPDARVAIDVAAGHGTVFVSGEVTSATTIDVEPIIARFAPDYEQIVRLTRQSSDIARGVDIGGAGDQGVMVGYACNETEELLPLEVVLSRSLNQHLYQIWPYDGKTQVTLDGNKIVSIVASFQNSKTDELRSAVNNWLVKYQPDGAPELLINPAGEWNIGGFDADTGLTGRKLVVDNYGPRVPIGGGAFSGKDPSKVDRSAAYMARRIAIDYLKSKKANEVFIYLAYAIGHIQPVEATVIVDGISCKISGYDLSPNGIIKYLDLKKPIYLETASYGHFGHTHFNWEK